MASTVLTLFGTRPEIIKLAPVIWELERLPHVFHTVNVSSGQHRHLLEPFARLLGVRIDSDLCSMVPDQSLNGALSRVVTALDDVLDRESPDLILVQGDTTTALAGALAGFNRAIPVGHVEAGLRSGDPRSPFPEEMNRRLISRLATWHFAATRGNRDVLRREGVAPDAIFLTGNPVVDALQVISRSASRTPRLEALLEATRHLKRLVVTTHRRESFGGPIRQRLLSLRRFVERHDDVAMIFPVHPNPAVREPAARILDGHARIHLTEPLDYADFLGLLSGAWLIASDSGGVQEEAASLGKPLVILRENTERPEAVEAGYARLAGRGSGALRRLLEEAHGERGWVKRLGARGNPFGDGRAAERIVSALALHQARPPSPRRSSPKNGRASRTPRRRGGDPTRSSPGARSRESTD